MSLFILGINHTTAPVEIRERIAFAPDRLAGALDEIRNLPGINEAVILSTCNRTELYCGNDPELEPMHSGQTHDQVINWLAKYHQLSPEELQAYIYIHPDQESIRHILRVATGLDSMILGEPQILGQIKEAYHQANQSGSLGTLLDRLFQHAFSVAKQVRTDTEIGASPVSVAFAAVSLAKQIFGDLGKQTALLIGAGETIELAARHLHNNKIGRMIIANRTVEHAHNLAVEFDAYAIALSELPSHLTEADIIISSTASPEPILDKASVQQALKTRKHKPMFIVDIAVPRDVEADVNTLEDVYLYTVDDLQNVIADNLKSRKKAAIQAEEIIDMQVKNFVAWMKSLDAVKTIQEFRHKAEASRDEVLQKALQQLKQGKPSEEVLQFLAHTLTNKLIHNPSVNLKLAGSEGRKELIRAMRELYGLNDKDKDKS
jgi:glutamyl-tRNA reductase